MIIIAALMFYGCNKENLTAQTMKEKMYITIGEVTRIVTMEDNVGTRALVAALQTENIVYIAHDYGNFEKVGYIGQSFPTDDHQTTTSAGDLVLSHSSKATITLVCPIQCTVARVFVPFAAVFFQKNQKNEKNRARYKFISYFCIVNDINLTMTYEQLKLENQLCFRLYTAARLTVGVYHPYLDPLGITYPQYLVLLVLWEQDKQPVCDIAKKMMLDTNTVTPLLQRMEKAGIVKRTRGKEDSRQRIVSLTEKGNAMQEQAKHIPECLRNDVALKTGDEEEILKIIPALEKLIEGLKQTKK